MYLSKLEIQGFKSFAERTNVHFAEGVTAIVGPNGCGKSNIVDAVRWVVGEQRARILRSDKMENVIFNGTSKRRAVGMAEVQLTVENTRGVLPVEYSEVTLGRRLYRSGDSDYLLNGVKCRLQDITDLFMDTGMGAGAYSVIELKMIEEILSENAQDRRRLFEEAAGITKYKLRRRQALGKLDATQADLTRLGDLLDEIDKRVRSLKRQADKAAKFEEYDARRRRLELALAQTEYDRLRTQREALGSERGALEARGAELEQRLDADEARLADLRREAQGREDELGDARVRLAAHDDAVARLEADLRLEDERLDAARREHDRLEREAVSAETRQEELAAERERLDAEHARAVPAAQSAEAARDDARQSRDRTRTDADAARAALDDARRAEREAEAALTARRRALDRLASRTELLGDERTRLRRTREALDDDAESLDARARHAERTLEDARAKAEAAAQALDDARAERTERQAALDAARERLGDAARERSAAEAEAGVLDALVASYDEFSDAVRYLAAEEPGELLTVADVLACDDDARLALDAALGDLAGCVLARDEAEARAAVARLRDGDHGQATFLLLDRLPDVDDPAPVPGARPLLDLVRTTDAVHAPVARVLLRDAYLAPDLDAAVQTARPGLRLFTPAGEWADARGLVRGGSRPTGSSPVGARVGRREQRDAARTRVEAAREAHDEAARAVETAAGALDAVPYADRRAAREAADRAAAEAEKARTRVAYEEETLARRRADADARLETLARELEESREEAARLEAGVAEAADALEGLHTRRADAEAAFAHADEAARAALARYSEAHVAAVQTANHRDNLARDLERVRTARAELDARRDERDAERVRLDERIAAAEARRTELAARHDVRTEARPALEAAVESARTALGDVRQAAADVDAALRALRMEREQALRDENTRAVRLAEIETRADDLVENIREDFDHDLAAERVPLDDDFEESAARDEVRVLRDRIRALGAVNALALEAYEEERERLDFLTAQRDDLAGAERTLLDTIDEINTTAAERFDATYEAVRKSFQDLFHRLFGGDAAADLYLVDPTDKLESAIEVRARPRGKRPSTLAQLSGGEKTLTAIALLFAIYLVKPSPFCILDEVDAPLDDANVERFMRLIREFAATTQFVLVTHNKRTMELADRMYGVTMQEQGVSRLVSVAFDEAAELAEDDAA